MHLTSISWALRLLVRAAFVMCSSLESRAQYDGGDSGVEDWQLYDEEQADSTTKPRHHEWKNMAYVRYSPSQYAFPGYTRHFHFQELAVGWARSVQVADSIALFVEPGAEMEYSFSSDDGRHSNLEYRLLTFRVPVNLTYKFYLSRTRNIALAPLAGVHFRVIAVKKEKGDQQTEGTPGDGTTASTHLPWDRCQLGWQVGLRLQVERFYLAASYGRDFPDKSKRPQIHQSGITAGMCF